MFEKLRQNKELWDLFTRKEEYNSAILDKYQRFPYYLSKCRDILEPEVSKFLIKNGLKIKYPGNKKFAVCLTHDVDALYISKQVAVKKTLSSLKRYKFKKALDTFKVVFSRINKKWNPLWNFEEIIELEKKYNVKSTFYFLADSRNKFNSNYSIESLKAELNSISKNGWEIGLHGSYDAYDNLDQIRKEKEKLEQILGKEIISYRNHYLRFKTPGTWELFAKAGFKYDTTFGYADMVGFRNGTCHPFKPFNLNTNKEINILEIPLTIMDGTLFDYMKLSIEGAWEITKLLIDRVEKYNGIITILWHNTSFDNIFRQGLKGFYEKILEYCYKKNAWMTNGKEIWEHYTNQSI